MKALICLLLLISQTSCGADPLKNLLPEERVLKKLIEDSYRECVEENSHLCPYKNSRFRKGSLKVSSQGQRILVLDSEREQNFPSVFYKNKERALELLKLQEGDSGLLKTHLPKIEAPLALDEIFHLVRACEKKGKKLEELAIDTYKLLKLHHKIKWEKESYSDAPHGQHVFDILAHYNPEAQFVVGSFPELSNKTFCEMEKEKESVRLFFKRAAESYLFVLKKYEINYVNISYASTLLSLSKHNKRICGGSLTLKELSFYLREKSNFLDRLSEGAPGVIFFQALPNEYEEDYLWRKDSKSFSASERPNFLRISYWSKFVPEGRSFSERILKFSLPPLQRNLWSVTDLYMNSGFDESDTEKKEEKYRRSILELPYAGFHLSSKFYMSNSFATPLALSYVNYLVQKGDSFSFIGRKKIFDPLAEKKLMIFLKR